jgi:hypothetical protein
MAESFACYCRDMPSQLQEKCEIREHDGAESQQTTNRPVQPTSPATAGIVSGRSATRSPRNLRSFSSTR